MQHVSVSEARATWSKLVAEAAAGKEVVITRYGQPVARLSPPRASAHFPDSAHLRASMPPMHVSAGQFVRDMRDEERY